MRQAEKKDRSQKRPFRIQYFNVESLFECFSDSIANKDIFQLPITHPPEMPTSICIIFDIHDLLSYVVMLYNLIIFQCMHFEWAVCLCHYGVSLPKSTMNILEHLMGYSFDKIMIIPTTKQELG